MKYLITVWTLFYSIVLLATDYHIDTVRMTSTVLNETRIILIFTPDGLQNNDSVSILYMLDGEFAKTRYDAIMKEQSVIPPVGIGIINVNRNRDMLPVKEPDKFLNFIETELIPKFEANYQITRRILFGHSFAGGFAIYSLINKPGLFDQYIASSPTPIMEMTDSLQYRQLDNRLDKKTGFYFSYGSEDMKQVKKWGEVLYKNLANMNFEYLRWKRDIFQGDNHNTSDRNAIIKGIIF
jgi:predicted alpha/beta superfamily hydrolase